ncbi:neprilysin-1-like isoform X2 [Bombus pyrosoma]|uniref:neprilysin-1-like isoform X2 n=1 Tax=Bombus pyrosoma TaxID=396416 RepID=UPI001CB8DED2|nr:neprilysin-1-like isoform X2 [Bombus pyrosoma]
MLLEICLFSLIIFIDARATDVTNDARSVCLTEECKRFATRILTNMNASADPCEDFYEYACGNWPTIHSLPLGENSWQLRAISDNENKRRIEEMMKMELRGDEISSVKVAKQWYKTCMDTEDMNKRGMEPILFILNEIGGWPIIIGKNKWNDSEQKWQNIDDYYAHLRGSNLLHDVRVTAYGDTKEKTVILDVPDMPPYSWMLEEFFEADNETLAIIDKRDLSYWKYIVKIISKIAEAAGFNTTRSQLEEEIEDIFNFEWKLLKISSMVNDYVNMTVAGFQKWYDNLKPRTHKSMVNWIDKIMDIFNESGIDISEDTMLKVTSPDYYEKLIPLLDETPSRTIVNYLHWSFVSSMITETTDEMRELDEKMAGNDSNVQQDRSDWCIKKMELTKVVAHVEYARRYFSDDMIETALNALNDIEEEMKIEIKESNWANKEIKDLALRRIKFIKKNIGYPDWYNNATIMENYSANLTMGPRYFENALEVQRYYKFKELRLLKHKDMAESWIIDPLTLNAIYLSQSNSITVPLANLQEPFFSRNQPNTINYALTGFLLAHELHHPFDELRRLFNERGEEINWPDEMTKQYYKSAQCFVDQYDNYTLDGTSSGPRVKNYGNQTFDENMPDTMGLKTAFKAYKRREIINGKPESTLPGLQMFNNDQIFFLSSANLWCETRNSQTLVTDAKLDIHSIGRLRCIGALSNSEDFTATFSCSLGSPMSPKKKCNIWKI